MNRFKFDENIRKISVVENGRSLSFRRIFLSLLNVDSFWVYVYNESARAVYSYKCNWDLYIQHIDRPPPPHCMPPPRRSIIGFLLHPIQILNTQRTLQQVGSRYSFTLPACQSRVCILKYQRFKLRATQAQMCFLPIPRRNTCQTRTSFPSLRLVYYCGWESMKGYVRNYLLSRIIERVWFTWWLVNRIYTVLLL